MSKIVAVLTSMALAVLLAGTTAALSAAPSVGQTTTVTLVGAGDIADCSDTNDEATAGLLSNIPGIVVTLGDNAYANGTRAQFANCYDNYRLSDQGVFDSSRSAWWGKYKERTMPTLGNHEYLNSSDSGPKSQPYFDYFGARKGFLQQEAAPVPAPGLTKGEGYYSYDLGSWHIVALNSNCDYVSCGGESAQARWLRNDLTNHPARCTLAYMHHPLYASGTGSDTPEVKPLWQILYDHHAEVILSAHAHRYERFRRINPDDRPDSVNGIRLFIVGTGGEPGGVQYGEDDPNMRVKNTDTPGVIKLSLSAGSYAWKFVPVAGKTFTDSGSDRCH